MLPPEYTFLISLGLGLVLYYYVGRVYQRYRTQRTYRWLKQGLTSLGDSNSVQANWVGSSRTGARINLPRAHAPFKQIELMYVLEGRDVLWLLNLWRGKRDLLIVRGVLRRPPTGEIDILAADNRALQTIRQETASPWTVTDGPHQLVIARRGLEARQIERLRPFLEQYGLALKRLSYGPKEPHFLIAVRLANLPHPEAAVFLQAIRTLAGKLG